MKRCGVKPLRGFRQQKSVGRKLAVHALEHVDLGRLIESKRKGAKLHGNQKHRSARATTHQVRRERETGDAARAP